jgi:hypothetical protein
VPRSGKRKESPAGNGQKLPWASLSTITGAAIYWGLTTTGDHLLSYELSHAILHNSVSQKIEKLPKC